jgi:hypothetical protein
MQRIRTSSVPPLEALFFCFRFLLARTKENEDLPLFFKQQAPLNHFMVFLTDETPPLRASPS